STYFLVDASCLTALRYRRRTEISAYSPSSHVQSLTASAGAWPGNAGISLAITGHCKAQDQSKQ
ncbi:hypothetical protein, partial [Rhizobium favelukesii]